MTRRSVLTKNELTFREDIIHEDELFTPQVFVRVKTMMYVNAFYYYRRYRENSIMTIQTPEQLKRSFNSYFKIFKELEKLYESTEYKKEQKKLVKRQMLSIYNGLQENKTEKVNKKVMLSQIKIINIKDKFYLLIKKTINKFSSKSA